MRKMAGNTEKDWERLRVVTPSFRMFQQKMPCATSYDIVRPWPRCSIVCTLPEILGNSLPNHRTPDILFVLKRSTHTITSQNHILSRQSADHGHHLKTLLAVVRSCSFDAQARYVSASGSEVPILVTYVLMPARELVLRPEMTIDTSAALVFTLFCGKHWKNMKEHLILKGIEFTNVYKALSWKGIDMNWLYELN